MWVLQNDVLMELPDDVPIPPGGRKIEVPAEFEAAPQDFRVENGALIKDPKPFGARGPQFTKEEIAFLKQFVSAAAMQVTPKEEK